MPNTYESIDAYIESVPPEFRPRLARMRELIREEAPQAEERTSWGMPTFWQGENLVHFAHHKNHTGFYPGAEAMEHFAKDFEPYKTSKGAVQLPHAQPLPEELVRRVTRWRVAQQQ